MQAACASMRGSPAPAAVRDDGGGERVMRDIGVNIFMLKNAIRIMLHNALMPNALQNGAFCVAKRPVSGCETGRIGRQNGLFRKPSAPLPETMAAGAAF